MSEDARNSTRIEFRILLWAAAVFLVGTWIVPQAHAQQVPASAGVWLGGDTQSMKDTGGLGQGTARAIHVDWMSRGGWGIRVQGHQGTLGSTTLHNEQSPVRFDVRARMARVQVLWEPLTLRTGSVQHGLRLAAGPAVRRVQGTVVQGVTTRASRTPGDLHLIDADVTSGPYPLKNGRFAFVRANDVDATQPGAAFTITYGVQYSRFRAGFFLDAQTYGWGVGRSHGAGVRLSVQPF